MSLLRGLKLKNVFTAFLFCGAFLFILMPKNASAWHSLDNYNKLFNGTLTAAEWNNLLYDTNGNIGGGDFVNTWLPATMNGPLGIATSSPASGLEVNGPIKATNFTGSLTATLNAANISSGAFGSNTGGGNYSFPGNVGIGTTNPNAKLEITGDVYIGDRTIAPYGVYHPVSVMGTNTNTSGNNYGLISSFISTPATNSSATYLGVYGNVDIIGSTNLNHTGTSYGVQGYAKYSNTGTSVLTNNKGVYGAAANYGNGTITNNYGIDGIAINNSNGTISANTGARGYAYNNNTGVITTNVGVYGISSNNSTGIVTDAYAGRFTGGNTSTGVITRFIGALVGSTSTPLSNNGTITNTYGLYIGDISNGVQTNYPYSIYSSDANTYNYLAGFVGISTTTPESALDVNGLIKMRSATITQPEDVVNKSYLDSAIILASSSIISQVATSSFWQGSLTGNVYNNNTGNIGIGTTAPGALLQLGATTNSMPANTGLFVNGTKTIRLGAGDGDADWGGYISASYSSGNEYVTFGSRHSSSDVSAITINNGNVGIGAPIPGYKLDILGSDNYPLRVKGNAGSGFILGSYDAGWSGFWSAGVTPSLTNYTFITHPTIGAAFNAPTGGYIQFDINDVIKMKLDTSGNLGIGTISPNDKLSIGMAGAAAPAGSDSTGHNNTQTYLSIDDYALANYGLVKTLVANATSSLSNAIGLWGGTKNGNIWNGDAGVGNVGIGTTAPGQHFSINDGGDLGIPALGAQGGQLSIKTSNVRGLLVGSASAGNVFMQVQRTDGTAEAYNILLQPNGGNVGIGTNNPTSPLQVGNRLTFITASTYYPSIGFNTYFDGGNWRTIEDDSGFMIRGMGTNTDRLDFMTAASGGTNGVVSPTTAMTILQNSNVGIGTTAPGAKLHVNGAIWMASSNVIGAGHDYGQLANTASGYLELYSGVTGYTTLMNTGAYNMNFGVNNSVDLTIQNGGNVGVGTTAPGGKMEILQNMSDYTAAFTGPHLKLKTGNIVDNVGFVGITYDSSTTANFGWSSGAQRSINGQSSFVWKYHNGSATGTEYMRINNIGNVGIGTTAPNDLFSIGNSGSAPAGSSNTGHNFTSTYLSTDDYALANYGLVKTLVANATSSLSSAIGLWGGTKNGNIWNGDAGVGNVGVGNTNPREKIDIAGSLRVGVDGELSVYPVSGGSCPSCGTEAMAIQTTIDGRTVSDGLPFDAASRHVLALQPNFGYVGIGTTTPTSNLHVFGSVNSVPVVTINHTGSNPKGLYVLGGHDSGDYSANFANQSGTSLMYIRGDGKIGIGTIAPDANLTVQGVTSGAITIKRAADSNQAYIGMNSVGVASSSNLFWSFGLVQNSQNFNIQSYNGSTLSSRLNIDTTGNIGIGTTAPNDTLSIGLAGVAAPAGSSGTGHNNTNTYVSTDDYALANYGLVKTLVANATSSLSSAIGLWGGTKNGNIWNGDAGVGNVGIGNTNPGQKLEVSGNVLFNSSALNVYLRGNSVGNPAISFSKYPGADLTLGAKIQYVMRSASAQESGALAFWTNPNTAAGTDLTERMRIDSSGNVGIGTTNPATLLDVKGGSSIYRQMSLRNGSGQVLWAGSVADSVGSYIANNAYYTTSYNFKPNYAAASGINFRQDGSTEFFNDTGLTVGTDYIPAKRMVILSGGAVGIGKTNPATLLDVNGTVTANAFVGPLTGTLNAQNVSAGEFGKNTGGGNFVFGATVSGNVGVGTTGPGAKLTIASAGGDSTTGLRFTNAGGTNYGNMYLIPVGTGATDGFYIQAQREDAPLQLGTATYPQTVTIKGGNIGIGTTTPSEKLTVQGDGASIKIQTAGNPASYYTKLTANWDYTNPVSLIGYSGQPIFKSVNGATRLDLYSNNAITMTLNSGNVGIGTTDPGAYRLKVAGDVAITGALLTQTGSDFAEEFKAPTTLEAGTVVVMGDEGYKSVKSCTKSHDKTVVGIVSDNPSIIAGRTDIDNKNPEKVIVAMMGVVTVKVTDINGDIEKGDLLTTSGVKGYAMKALDDKGDKSGTIIGKALENLDSKTGKIKVLVNLQ